MESCLEKLRPELLQMIVEYVDALEPARQSLYAFACVSKFFKENTKFARRSIARVRVTDNPAQLQDNVSQLIEHLGENRTCVRMLEVLPPPSQSSARRIPGPEEVADRLVEEHITTESNTTIPQEDHWKPIVDLLERNFVGTNGTGLLKDFVWGCSQAMPTSVIHALHNSQSRCRLHAHTFSLKSLYSEDPSNATPLQLETEAERLLADSPCLHSLMGPIYQRRLDHEPSRRLCAMNLCELLSTHNLHIRHIHLLDGHDLLNTCQRPWLEFCTPKGTDPRTKLDIHTEAHLLTLHAPDGFYPFARPNGILLDLSTLVSLTLYGTYSGDNLAYWFKRLPIGEKGALSALQELALQPDNQIYNYDSQRWDWNIATLLRGLRSLQRLRLFGAGKESFDVIPEHLGTHLRVLYLLHQPLSFSDVDNLSQSCQQVHDLRLGMHRTLGDSNEVKQYEFLGRMARLKKLSLDLHSVKDPVYKKPTTIRWALLSVAFDEEFAISVFEKIQSRSAQGESALVELVVRLANVDDTLTCIEKDKKRCKFYIGDLGDALIAIAQSWKIRYNPHETLSNRIRATKLKRESWSSRADAFFQRSWGWNRQPKTAWPAAEWERVWCEIWPMQDDTSHPYYSSLPLITKRPGKAGEYVGKEAASCDRRVIEGESHGDKDDLLVITIFNQSHSQFRCKPRPSRRMKR
ncbi:hypothetical protein AA0116_g12662 [Alternaria tenuissima]|nr:hypothetical protein AA0116_g12662 [Alternaria tenuissima]